MQISSKRATENNQPAAERTSALASIKRGVTRIAPERQSARHLQVPIDAILNAEFEVLQTTPEARKRIRGDYESYVTGMVNSVRASLDADKIRNYRFRRLVRKADERALFELLSATFYREFKASKQDRMLLATSIPENKFNCYSSSVLLADVLGRMGKRVDTMEAPGHVFLAGKTHAFETEDPATPTFPLSSLLNAYYPYVIRSGADGLYVIARAWAADMYLRRGEYEKSIVIYDELLALNPNDAIIWNNKGAALEASYKHDGALNAFEEAIKLNPRDENSWCGKGIVLYSLDRNEDALAAFDEAIRLNPESAEAWKNKIELLRRMGREEEADKTVSKRQSIPSHFK